MSNIKNSIYAIPRGFDTLPVSPASRYHCPSRPRSTEQCNIDFQLLNEYLHQLQKENLQYTYQKQNEPSLSNFPTQILTNILCEYLNVNDWIRVGQTCATLHHFCNFLLYDSVLVVDGDKEVKPPIGMTLARSARSFLNCLKMNPSNARFIRELIIDSDKTMTVMKLMDLIRLNSDPTKLEVVELFNKKCISETYHFVNHQLGVLLGHDCAATWSDNAVIPLEISKFIMPLPRITLPQVADMIFLPPTNTTKTLVISCGERNKDVSAFSAIGLLGKWTMANELYHSCIQNVTSLKLMSTAATDGFLSAFEGHRLPLVTSLSLTFVHRIQQRNGPNYTLLKSIFNLQDVKELEIRWCCQEYRYCNSCLESFFAEWAASTMKPIALKCLSLVAINSDVRDSNVLVFEPLFGMGSFRNLISGIHTLILYNSDADTIPLWDLGNRGIRFSTFMQSTMASIITAWDSIVHLPALKSLVIVDFMYRWLPYLTVALSSLNRGAIQSDLNPVKFMNQCQCAVCQSARSTMNDYVNNVSQFRDILRLHVTRIEYDWVPGSLPSTRLNMHPDQYRILYNFLVSCWKEMHGLKELKTTKSALEMRYLKTKNRLPISNDHIASSIAQHDFTLMTVMVRHALLKTGLFDQLYAKDVDVCIGGLCLNNHI